LIAPLQVGATIYKKTLDPMEKGVLSSTWGGGDRIDLALGAKIIDIIRREKLLNDARIMGEKIRRACHELVGKKWDHRHKRHWSHDWNRI
jgi:4-aminobutyrate aminotransferase